MIKTAYLDRILDLQHFKLAIDQAAAALEGVDFDAIVVTGNSGTLFGGALSIRVNRPLILVRKSLTGTHSFHLVEGDTEVKKLVFVDDLVFSGATRERVVQQVYNAMPSAVFIGELLYGDSLGDSTRYRSANKVYNNPYAKAVPSSPTTDPAPEEIRVESNCIPGFDVSAQLTAARLVVDRRNFACPCVMKVEAAPELRV